MERPAFSEMLANRRRELGFSIRQASRVLRLREDVLIAFEEGDFEQMPKSGYAQGMISSYARYLGLDANAVVEAYIDDFELYKKAERRRNSSARNGRRSSRTATRSGVSQPYVGSRGLLPTSGGLAGDMGSFATTRVHTRADGYGYEGVSEGEDIPANAQSRPYTNRSNVPSMRTYRSTSERGRRDIETMDVGEYDDDLRLGRSSRSYEAASTRAGRRNTHGTSTNRPRVNRRSSDPYERTSRSRTDRGRRRERQGVVDSLLGGGSSRIGIIAVIAVVIIISVILVLSVGSCVNQGSSTAKTVPVSAAGAESSDTSKQSSSSQSATSGASTTKDTETTGDKTNAKSEQESEEKEATSSTSSAQEKETSVSVSVADGAVTWLEVECDGKSDVAETVTGPWQKTYTVEDVISIQAGDTTAVSVVQNGRQVQFDSMASGIGTIRIQGTKKPSSSKDKESSSNSSKDSSAKTGNATSSEQQQEDGEEQGGESNATYDEYEESSYSDTYDESTY